MDIIILHILNIVEASSIQHHLTRPICCPSKHQIFHTRHIQADKNYTQSYTLLLGQKFPSNVAKIPQIDTVKENPEFSCHPARTIWYVEYSRRIRERLAVLSDAHFLDT